MLSVATETGDARMDERHLQISGSLEAVALARHFVHQAALEAGFDERAAHHCVLAADEACTNVIEHGYGVDGSGQVIDIWCRKEGDTFVITVLDDSPIFNPLTTPDPNPTVSLNEREPGGWGIFFIKKLMDHVVYDRVGSRNRLLMLKRIEPVQEMTIHDTSIHIEPVDGKIWQITFSGYISAGQSTEVERALNDQFGLGHQRLILDMSDVEYISSEALKIFVGAWQHARESKGNLVLVGVKPRILEMLQLIGLDLVFPLADTQAQAIAQFAKKKG
jgi:serine/threonine-protein kinase RsbW